MIDTKQIQAMAELRRALQIFASDTMRLLVMLIKNVMNHINPAMQKDGMPLVAVYILTIIK